MATPAKLVSLAEWKNKDTVETLEYLLREAKKGRITGLLYSCEIVDNDPAAGMTGSFARNPATAQPEAIKLYRLVNNHFYQTKPP